MFSARLKIIRKQHGLTQAELAEKIGLSQQAVGKWETGSSCPDQKTLQFLADFFGVSTDYLLGRQEDRLSLYRSVPEKYLIPIVGEVKAGYNALAYEDNIGMEPAAVRNPEEYFYLVVRGDSMEPHIRSGDLALVHQQADVESGELAIVLVDDGEGTLKRVIKQKGAVILQPFNTNYETLVFLGREAKRVRIMGKVVETKSKW